MAQRAVADQEKLAGLLSPEDRERPEQIIETFPLSQTDDASENECSLGKVQLRADPLAVIGADVVGQFGAVLRLRQAGLIIERNVEDLRAGRLGVHGRSHRRAGGRRRRPQAE